MLRHRLTGPFVSLALAAVLFVLIGGSAACTRPSPPTAVAADDPALLREVIQQQEQRVEKARADVAQVERELRMVRMRRRLLERAGRGDLAADLAYEEQALVARLTAAERMLADAQDALAIYRRSEQQPPAAG